MTATVIDPVCGMTINPAEAAASAEHQGTTYYFCSKHCHRAFTTDPGAYDTPAQQHHH